MASLITLDESDFSVIKDLFKRVFTRPPWNDDWSDDEQLNHYLKDLMGTRTPLVLGLVEGDELIGLSIGNIRHWCEGTEYFIEEFCIAYDWQGQGYGSTFLELIEAYLVEHDLHQIFLMTERGVPAYTFYQNRGFKELSHNVAFFKEF